MKFRIFSTEKNQGVNNSYPLDEIQSATRVEIETRLPKAGAKKELPPFETDYVNFENPMD